MKEVCTCRAMGHEKQNCVHTCTSQHIHGYELTYAPPTLGATTCIPLPVTEMASCDVVVVGMLPSSSQDEGTCGCGLLNDSIVV